MIDERAHTAGCAGKVSFHTFTQANKSATRSRGSKYATLAAYHCKQCGLFHVGTSIEHQKSATNRRRKTMQHINRRDYEYGPNFYR